MSAQTQRWLTIVVDGNTTLAPYWPRIVSEYLEKIVRSFCDDSFDQENRTDYELGLVLYTSNSKIGYYVQTVNWTNDVDFFLSCLPCLLLNGDDSNQLVMAEGLVKALMMYPWTQTQRVQRHCVMVAIGEPVPQRTLRCVPVPVVQAGILLGTQIKSQNVDVFEVAQMFPQLEVTFSMITPTEHPIFRAIFNLGNNVTEGECDPLTNYRIGEFYVLLSKNFKDAREVFQEQTIEAADAVTLEPQVAVPIATPQTHDAFSSANTSMNVFDDMIAELSANDDDVIFLSTKRSRTSSPLRVFNPQDLFQPNKYPSDHSRNPHQQQQKAMSSDTKVLSLEELREFEAGFEQALKDFTNEHEASRNKTSNITDLASTSSTQVTNSLLVEPTSAPSPSVGTVSTTPVVESNSAHVMPQTTISLSPAGPKARQGEVNKPENCVISSGAAVRLGLVEPLETHQTSSAGFAYGDSLFHDAPGRTMIRFEADLSASPQKFTGTSSTLLSSHHAIGQSSIIQFGPSSSTTQNFHCASTQSASHSARGNKNSSGTRFASHSAIRNSSEPHKTSVGASTHQFASHDATEKSSSSSIQVGASSLATQQTLVAVNTQFSSHDAMGTSSFVQFGTPSSAPHQTFPHASEGPSIVRLQSSSSASPQLFHHGQLTGGPSESFSTLQIQPHVPVVGYQHHRFVPSLPHTSAVGESTCVPPVPRMSQIFDLTFFLPHQSSFVDFNEYVHTWEGSIAGRTYTRSTSNYKAMAFRKTTPVTLTSRWETKLSICHYIPKKAVHYTKSQMKSKPYSMFFYITEFDNLDLFHHLKKKKVHARIDLPSQVLMLSPTENVFFYKGEVFPGDTIFIEPASSAKVMNRKLNSGYA